VGCPARTSAARWQVVLVLMAVVGIGHFNRVSISVAGDERLIPASGIKEWQMGLVYSGYLLLYTLAMVPGGWFIDRVGPKAAMLSVLLGSTIGMTLTGLAGYVFSTAMLLWVMLLLTRSLMGLFNAPQHPGAARLVGNWIPPAGQNLSNGLVIGSACLGIACTYVLFGKLIDLFDWTGAALIAGGLTLALTLIWLWIVANRPEAAEQTKGRVTTAAPGSLRTLLRNRSLLFLTFSYGALSYIQYLFVYWMKYYFEGICRFPKEESRVYAMILTLMWGLGMVVGGWLSDWVRQRLSHRLGWALVPVGGLLLAAVAVLLGVLCPLPKLALVCFGVAMAGIGTPEGSFWTLSVELGGQRGGTAAGILNTGGNGIGLLAPLLTPLVSQWLGWQVGFGLASVACLLAALSWWWIDPGERAIDLDTACHNLTQ
jgi:MFS transporter, ACS family, D-galactonate transporter